MSLTKEAIQQIQETAIKPDERIVNVDGRKFVIDEHGNAKEVGREVVSTLETNTLSSIVDYIKECDYQADKLYLQIVNEHKVRLQSELKEDGTRDFLMCANAIVPEQNFCHFMDMEQLNIELQSKFQETTDRGIVLQVIGNLKDENVQETSDDGVSQRVTIKSGVATVASVRVPNPVKLTPFSTFQEVDQPERLFVFRMREGAQGALFDTDDNSWKLEAINNIREYFATALMNETKVVILA